jgi:hypothetical protein
LHGPAPAAAERPYFKVSSHYRARLLLILPATPASWTAIRSKFMALWLAKMRYSIHDKTLEAKRARILTNALIDCAKAGIKPSFSINKMLWKISLYFECGNFKRENWRRYHRTSDAAKRVRASGDKNWKKDVTFEHAGQPWDHLDILVVKVETDDGLVGWGEAFGHTAIPATKAALDTIVAPLLIGREAGDINALMPTPDLARRSNVIATPHIGGLTRPRSKASRRRRFSRSRRLSKARRRWVPSTPSIGRGVSS